MPPSEKENKNEIGNKRRHTVPNDDARKATSQVCQNGRDDTGHCDCDPEPKTEEPRANGDWRHINNQERVLETGNVVKPADEGDKQKTSDDDETPAKHCYNKTSILRISKAKLLEGRKSSNCGGLEGPGRTGVATPSQKQTRYRAKSVLIFADQKMPRD